MDESFADHLEDNSQVAARHTAQWRTLMQGQLVDVRDSGWPPELGVVDTLTPDGSVVWLWLEGQSLRKMFVAGDPVELTLSRGAPQAY